MQQLLFSHFLQRAVIILGSFSLVDFGKHNLLARLLIMELAPIQKSVENFSILANPKL